MTNGARPIENTVFFTRLGQKLSSLLMTRTLSGMAYEVDMQLRPHGASGALVATMVSFFRYEREQAWVWEHQALIRARAIAGAIQLQARFEQERVALLMQSRDGEQLKESVRSMRQKMREHLDKS
jgi:glutamate-ammonia-ligase adenylyltransferase